MDKIFSNHIMTRGGGGGGGGGGGAGVGFIGSMLVQLTSGN